MKLIVYTPETVSPEDFVSFWASQYAYPSEHLYTDNIGKPLMRDSVHKLFEWKNGSPLAMRKYQSVENNYVARIDEVKGFPKDIDAGTFLERFRSGGAIWRIFWLHCWQHERFPIYDQHVHRAMVYIETGKIEEIPNRDKDKIKLYLDDYLAFHQQFRPALDQRSIDKALWRYGKFLKELRFPNK